ncbi:PBP1A family penicillin-binding protein [Candidatus Kaiserbacteria bacterium]|nr:PBP1A family penicillin-binding protein [Candidatus Kaiserbacteria bacterium]
MKRFKTFVGRHYKRVLLDIVVGIGVFALVVGGSLLLWVSTLEIPDLQAFEQRRVLQSTKIYDRTGEILLYDLHADVRRTIVPYENISRHVINATVAIEDDTFFEHAGIRPLSIIRAALANIQGGDLLGGQGGSTITQQVVKNALLKQEKTLTRKVKEAVLAMKLEHQLSKEEILSHYLNESPYGGTLYGVEEASQSFFGKPVSDVTLAEAAYIAALPQAPTYYSPYGNHRAELESRKDLVLSQMLKNNFITKEEYEQAKSEKVEFLPQATSGIRAPHFVFYVREYLAKKYGEESLAERGFRVVTTLDAQLQEKAEEIVKKYALQNEKTFNAENAAMVATDPKTGEILVMVGSRDYFDETIDGNFNIAVADRQPGSSFKPFVYAAAFEKGYTPETVLFDLKTQFSTACSPDNMTSEGGCYSPVNYDGQFRGPISLRNALAQSINIPAVKTLYLAGIDNSIKLARDMGITGLANRDRYGLTLVLGGGEVQLVDMVGAYGVFAHEGKKVEKTPILRIEDPKGNVLEETKPKEEEVLDRNVALQISSILSDNAARTPLYGSNSQLYFGGTDVAAKTGTTNDYRDAWVIGYTPNIAVGCWAGNNDNRSMEKKISGLIVTPMWREFMDFALEKRPKESFAEPAATPPDVKPILRGVWLDTTPAPPTDGTSGEESQLGTAISSVHTILYYVDKDNPRGPYPASPGRDPQFNLWEWPIAGWRNALIGAATKLQSNDTASTTDDTDPDDNRRRRRNRDEENN